MIDIIFWITLVSVLIWCFFLIGGKNTLSDFLSQEKIFSSNQYPNESKNTVAAVGVEVRAVTDEVVRLISKIEAGNPNSLPECFEMQFHLCWASYSWGGGDKFVGEWRENKQNGLGTMIYGNGYRFIGQFSQGKKDGLGEFTEPNGEKYVGEFRYGEKTGKGIITYLNGEMYVGELKDNKLHGRGIRYRSDGTIKEFGIYEKDQLVKIEYPPFDMTSDTFFHEKIIDNIAGQVEQLALKFEAKNVNHLKLCPEDKIFQQHSCWGKYSYSNGDNYVGEFKDGRPHGFGKVNFLNGDKYIGDWKDSKPNGLGTMTYAGGDKYIGEWRNSKRHGQGVFALANGDRYTGEWKDDEKNGYGTYSYLANNRLKGDRYAGAWKDGKKNGHGTHTFLSGYKYVGEYSEGEPHGEGMYVFPDGRRQYGK